jgi:hypothetical protein
MEKVKQSYYQLFAHGRLVKTKQLMMSICGLAFITQKLINALPGLMHIISIISYMSSVKQAMK